MQSVVQTTMDVNQMSEYLNKLNVSRDASGTIDFGLPDETTKLFNDHSASLKNYSELLARHSPPEVVMILAGLIPYEYTGCYEDKQLNFEKHEGITVDQQEMYHMLLDDIHYILKGESKFLPCKRCKGEICLDSEFYDRGMCGYCLEEAYGCKIDNCVVCCDVNYIGREGRCIICDMDN